MRKLVSPGSPFEPRIGFSRAVNVGQIVAVSGTVPNVTKGDKIGALYAFIDNRVGPFCSTFDLRAGI